MAKYRAIAVVGLARATRIDELHLEQWLVADGPQGYLLWSSGSSGLDIGPQQTTAYLYELGDDLAGEIAGDLELGGDTLLIPQEGVAQYWVGVDAKSQQLLETLEAD